jgi:hypothetical protein
MDSRPKGMDRMELQPVGQPLAGHPDFVDALRTAVGNDTPAAAPKELRTEPARLTVLRLDATPEAEETIIPDLRAWVTPAQSVEQKLTAMLRSGAAIPVSHFRLAKLCRKG